MGHLKAVILCAILLAAILHLTSACSEAVCASIASKCMLTGSCDCDTANLTSCTCCKDCTLCLDRLYEECCSCFKLCPEPWVGLGLHSQVEEYDDSHPELFHLLTDEDDAKERWVTYTYPVDHQLISSKHSKKYKIKLVPVDSEGREQEVKISGSDGASAPGGDSPADLQVTLNCTVAFLSQCRAREKCSLACRTMGANAFRWFNNGCCECIGETCINFGINQSRCLRCSEEEQEYVSDVTMDAALAAAYGDDSEYSASRDAGQPITSQGSVSNELSRAN